MASCSGNGSRGHHKFTLNVNETGTNTSANTSTVSFSLVLSPITKGYNWSYSSTVPVTYSININGTTYSGNIMSYDGSSTVTVRSGSLTVGHNNDGSKSINFSFSVSEKVSASYLTGNASGSGSMTLTKIARQANVTSATDFNDEGNPTIKYSNPGGFKINARLEFAGESIRRDNISNTGSYTFDLTDAERDLLRSKTPNSNSMTVREVIATYVNSSSENYWSWQDKTMTIVNANPIFTNYEYEDISKAVNVTDDEHVFVKGISKMRVTINSSNKMATQKYATAKNYVATMENKTVSVDYSDDTVTIDVGTIENLDTSKLSVRAFDSRNNSTEVLKDIKVYDYYKPEVNVTVERENNFEKKTTLKIDGKYEPLKIDNDNKNWVNDVYYRYKEDDTDTWTSWQYIDFLLDDGTFTCNDVILSLDNTREFDFEIRVRDRLEEVTLTRHLNIGQAIVFISSNLENLYVNGSRVLTEDELHEIIFEGKIAFANDIMVVPEQYKYVDVYMQLKKGDEDRGNHNIIRIDTSGEQAGDFCTGEVYAFSGGTFAEIEFTFESEKRLLRAGYCGYWSSFTGGSVMAHNNDDDYFIYKVVGYKK